MFDRLFEFLKLCWEFVVPFVLVDEWQRGVVLRFGRWHRDLGPGFHWLWPGIEQAITDSVITDTQVLPFQPLTTRDGVQVSVQALLTYRVVDFRKLATTVEGREQALHDSASGVIASEVSRHTWDEVRAPEFVQVVYKAVRRRGFRYGIELDEVQFPGLQRTRSYLVLSGGGGGS